MLMSKLAPCVAEPVKLDSYGLASCVPYTPLPQYLPQLPPSVWTSLRTSHFLPAPWDTGSTTPPILLPVLLVWCYQDAHRLKPLGAMGTELSLTKVPPFEASALVKFGQNWPNGFK